MATGREDDENADIEDDQLTNAVLEFIENYQKSIAIIHLPNHGIEATGFCVGDGYLMTAYHVIGPLISKIIDEITYFIQDEEKKPLLKRLGYEDEAKNADDTKVMQKVLKHFLRINSTDVGLLFTYLSDQRVDTDNINANLNDNCKAVFGGREYSLDYKIVFGNANIDVAILKIKGQEPPLPFSLDDEFSNQRVFLISTYDNDTKEIIVKEAHVFKSDIDFQKLQEDAIDWWRNIGCVEKNDIEQGYKKHSTVFDAETGCVVLQTSGKFRKGASGSPIMYLSDQSVLIVAVIYQRGHPEFYYDNKRKFKGKQLNEKYFFQTGTATRKLAALLNIETKRDLHDNLFSDGNGMPLT